MSSDDAIVEQVIQFLKERYGFPDSAIRREVAISTSNKQLVADIVIFSKINEKEVPSTVVELKEGIHPIAEKQLFTIMKELDVKYGILSNGNDYIYYESPYKGQFTEIPAIPAYNQDKVIFNRESLNACPNLSYKLAKIASLLLDELYSKGFHSTLDVLYLIEKILICKIIDEHSTGNILFHTLQDPLRKGISELYDKAKSYYPDLFPPYDKIDVGENILRRIVQQLESYSITKTDKEVVREAYESLAAKMYSKKYSYLFVTPKEITDFIIELLKPGIHEKVLDPSVGSGNFLASCASFLEDKINKNSNLYDKKDSSQNVNTYLFGLEMNLQLANIVRAAMILQGYDNIRILVGNIVSASNLLAGEKFDIIVMNSLSGHTIAYDDLRDIPIWIPKRVKSEFLSTLVCLNILVRGGRMAVILPESFFFSDYTRELRDYLITNFLVKAIISLPAGTYLPYSGVKSSLLIVEKPLSQDFTPSEQKIFLTEISDVRQLGSDNSDELNVIAERYSLFLEGKEKEPSINKSNIFIINSDQLRNENWTLSYQRSRLADDYTRGNWARLGDVASISNGVSVSSSKYARKANTLNLPYIRITDITEGEIKPHKIKYVNPEELKNVIRYIVKENDILFSTKGTIGKTAIVKKEFDNSIASSQLAIIKVKDKNINPEYVYYVLTSSYLKKQVYNLRSVVIIPSLSLKELLNIRIPIPPLTEQQRIVESIKQEEDRYYQALDYVKKTMPERIDDILMGFELNA